MPAEIPTITLPSGAVVPALAYGAGTAWLKDTDIEIDRRTVDGFRDAIELGYRHIDGAQMYHTEKELGVALKESGVPRAEFFLSTKALFVTDIENSLEQSLTKMQTDYVDLYLVHKPFDVNSTEELQDVWRAMERCFDKGMARHIGLSNCTTAEIDAVLSIARIQPSAVQVEMHPFLQQAKIKASTANKGITLEGFGSLVPITKMRTDPVLAILKKLAEKYSVTEAIILLRWVLDQGAIVVTTSTNKDRLRGYITDVGSFKLAAEEVTEISEISKDGHFRGFFDGVFGSMENP